MAAARTIKLHEETVGEPRGDERDVVVVELDYVKGRGYVLTGRAQKRDSMCVSYLLFGGIASRELLEPAKRFGAKKLATIAEALKANGKVAEAAAPLRAELERRKAAGEEY